MAGGPPQVDLECPNHTPLTTPTRPADYIVFRSTSGRLAGGMVRVGVGREIQEGLGVMARTPLFPRLGRWRELLQDIARV